MLMYMNGTILDAEMSMYYSGVDVNLYDKDERQTYKAQIVGGLTGLPELLQLRKQNAPDAQLAAAAQQVEMPPLMQDVPIRVRRVKTNKAGFTTLICVLGVDEEG
jgi:hypothetical protein